MFRGREVTHPERGVMILDRLAEDLEDLAIVEQRPIQDGRNMTMMLGPSKAILAGTLEEERAEAQAAAAAAAEQAAGDAEAAAAVPAVNGDAEAAPATEPEPETEVAPEAEAEAVPAAEDAPADD